MLYKIAHSFLWGVQYLQADWRLHMWDLLLAIIWEYTVKFWALAAGINIILVAKIHVWMLINFQWTDWTDLFAK